ncbi:MAG: hypothetical protein WC027_00630 [Candidatus Paceibacterota bacterium]
MNKVYIITYNPVEPFNKALFHNYIKSLHNNNYISDWWHYIDETYLVVSSLPVNQLYNATFPGVPGRYIFIVEVNLNNAQGWLPPNAWVWIRKYKNL